MALRMVTEDKDGVCYQRVSLDDVLPGEEHPLIGTAIYFHLTKGRAKKTEEQAMDNLWLELPWWFD